MFTIINLKVAMCFSNGCTYLYCVSTDFATSVLISIKHSGLRTMKKKSYIDADKKENFSHWSDQLKSNHWQLTFTWSVDSWTFGKDAKHTERLTKLFHNLYLKSFLHPQLREKVNENGAEQFKTNVLCKTRKLLLYLKSGAQFSTPHFEWHSSGIV